MKRFFAQTNTDRGNNYYKEFDTETEAIEWAKKRMTAGDRGVTIFEAKTVVKRETPPIKVVSYTADEKPC